MLDKTKVYAGYSGDRRKFNQPPCKNFQQVKVLFEDDISYYVESLKVKDNAGNCKRFSVKKHCFVLIEIDNRNTVSVGDKFGHINGRGPYTVTVFTNQDSNNPKYETTVVYQGANGKIWSKTLADFSKKMIKI